MGQDNSKQANRLVQEKSPYLLQHAYNPVDWYPWSDEAFDRARLEDKPIFLSIGYSTCHWCHVMEQESFEDEEVAALLNRNFISIKVDREERPDLDQLYMAACQAFTGQGGWPLTVIMTADKKPFFAGTYFPKHSRYGIIGLVELLTRLSAVWKQERTRAEQSAEELTRVLYRQVKDDYPNADLASANLPPEKFVDQTCNQFESSYDRVHGGFGGAPKFPSPHQLTFLLRCWNRTGEKQHLEIVLHTLRAMHRGGIFDQLGYGIHRYSVDSQWLVPHFEKMLYDQATTALAALEAYQASEDEEMAQFARNIFDYVLSELSSPEGAFYSAEDADSEGEEGTFYVWRRDQIIERLGAERGALVADYYGVTDKGNFEHGKNVLHRPHDDHKFLIEKGISKHSLTPPQKNMKL